MANKNYKQIKKSIHIESSLPKNIRAQSRQVGDVERPVKNVQDSSLDFTPLKTIDNSKFTASVVSTH